MPGEGNNNRRQGGHGLAARIRDQFAQQNQGEICEETAFPKECEILENSFTSLNYSDVYLYCCIKAILKDKREKARKEIESIVFGKAEVPPVNQCEAWLPDFKYKNFCSNFDLKDDEKIILWLINGSKEELGFGLGSLYSNTKVFLDVREGNIKDTKWNENEDNLGYYTIESPWYSGPQVWLIMDNITAEAERLCIDRKYIIAKVYIHEMMHRFYDLRPDKGWKPYVKEIEEPMAEFATLKFIEELSKQNSIFEILLPIAIVMTEGLRKSKKHFIYALGVDLYYKAPIKLIFDYQRISTLLHRSSEVFKPEGEKLDPSPMKYVEEYIAQCEQDKDSLANLVGPIRKCIETYAKFFPQDKGTE
jgi:hypothetical protein